MTNDSTPPLSISSAAVVESSLMAFGAGMSLQSRTDAKNSFLFATLVANNPTTRPPSANPGSPPFCR